MKYGFPIAAALLVVGCAVGSDAETVDAPTSPAAKVDAGGSTSPAFPGGDPAPSSDDAGPGAASDDGGGGTPKLDAGVDSAPAPTSACTFTGELAAYDLTTVVGTGDLPAARTGGKVAATSLSRLGVTAVSSSQAMNSSDWPIGGADDTKHYVFTVTPPAGCSIKLTSLSIDLKASATGPSSAAVTTSLDSFGSMKPATVTTAGGASSVTLSGTSSSAIEIHVLGYDASSAAGTMRIETTLSLTGQVTP